MNRNFLNSLALAVAYLVLDIVEAFACLAAIAALAGLLMLMLPAVVAIVTAVLVVCTAFGYRRARTREGDQS